MSQKSEEFLKAHQDYVHEPAEQLRKSKDLETHPVKQLRKSVEKFQKNF